MTNREKQIEDFMEQLRNQSINNESLESDDIGHFLEHFAISCKKCGSSDIFVSWEDGGYGGYGGYTGYAEGQKLFKCNTCGNAYSFWN